MIASTLIRWATGRRPDIILGDPAAPYLRRWHLLPRNPILNVYIHNIQGPDPGRAPHDHPWENLTYVLRGGYVEARPDFSLPATAFSLVAIASGAFVFRRATARHAIVEAQPDTWTLFVTGPRRRVWGFWCDEAHPPGESPGYEGPRFVPWTDYCDPEKPGMIGRGCGQA